MKKKIGELYDKPIVIGNKNEVEKHEIHIDELSGGGGEEIDVDDVLWGVAPYTGHFAVNNFTQKKTMYYDPYTGLEEDKIPLDYLPAMSQIFVAPNYANVDWSILPYSKDYDIEIIGFVDWEGTPVESDVECPIGIDISGNVFIGGDTLNSWASNNGLYPKVIITYPSGSSYTIQFTPW